MNTKREFTNTEFTEEYFENQRRDRLKVSIFKLSPSKPTSRRL